MNRINLYDLTGLFIRQVSETPTGIDRVDLKYARYLLDKHLEHTMFIKQHEEKLIVLSADDANALVKHLESNWTSKTQDNSLQKEAGLSFRIKHHGLWEPDLDMFFSMPFAERFNFLLKQNLIINLGREFQWVDSGPAFFRVLSVFIASSSRLICKAFIKIGRLVGILVHTKNIKTAFLSSFTKKNEIVELKDHIDSNYPNKPAIQFNYTYISYTRCHPIDALLQLSQICQMCYTFYIHDFIQLDYPEYFFSANDEMTLAMNGIMKLNPDLIVNSELTRERLHDYCKRRELTFRSVTIATIGVDDSFNSQTIENIESDQAPYFVVVSTIEPRKNHLMLLNIWRNLASTADEPIPHLYIIGKRGWKNENVVDMIEQCKGIKPYVHEMSDLKDSELLKLITGAKALLFPSFVEGWGMPLVESLTLGTPVICSNIPAFYEAGQNIPEYIDPIDGIRWQETISNYCQPQSAMRKAQLDRLKSFQPPTWDEHFRVVEYLFSDKS